MAAEPATRGADVEAAARRHLENAGLRWLAGNVRYRGGELDLVMLDGTPAAGTLVFVEVRARADAARGGAAASVGAVKQRRLVLAARHYLLRFRQPPPCRFDVVALDGDRVEWLRAAFDAG